MLGEGDTLIEISLSEKVTGKKRYLQRHHKQKHKETNEEKHAQSAVQRVEISVYKSRDICPLIISERMDRQCISCYPDETSPLFTLLYGLHFQSIFAPISCLVGSFYIPILFPFQDLYYEPETTVLLQNTITGKKPKQTKPQHNRCSLLIKKQLFSNYSEGFFLIEHLHSNPWWSSEFLQHL